MSRMMPRGVVNRVVREIPFKQPKPPAWTSRLRRRWLTWWRTLVIDVGYAAAIIIGGSTIPFEVAVLTSRFSTPLKWLWSAVLQAVAGFLLFAWGMWKERQNQRAAYLEALSQPVHREFE